VDQLTLWEPLNRAELPALRWVSRVRLGGPVDRFTRTLTTIGEHGAVWYLVAAVAARRDPARREQWLAAGAKVAGIYLLNTAIKLLLRRRRPELAAIGSPSSLSFPSSHAATSFAAARLYGDLAPGARGALYAGAVAMTGSRLHFCVHYPSDLVAGAAIGDAAAALVS
jgi:membrane-associated phospholipid phosphatase